MTEEVLDETTGELVPVSHTTTARTVDLRDRATDSWTDVLDDVIQLSRGIANTEFVPKGLRGSMEKVSAAILYSRELGLPPMTGLGSTHVIEGKAGISAELMRALVLQAGHQLAIKESTRERCEIWGRRKGTEEWTKAVWTIQEAGQTQVFISKEKGWQPLSSKTTWRSWPTEMLLARCTTRLVRMIFPDVAHGMRTVEELQDMQAEEVVEAEIVGGPPAPAPVARKRVSPRKAAPAKPGPAEPVETAEEDAGEAPDASEQAPVARARVARPAPRKAPEPAPSRVPEPEPEPVNDERPAEVEVVEAEIVPDVAAEDATARKKATTTILLHWQRLGVEERVERLWYTGVLAGREIESTKDLTLTQLRDVASTLERSKDMAAVEAFIKERGSDAAR